MDCLTLACFSFQSAVPVYRDLHLQYLLSRITRHCDRVREYFQMAEYMRKHPLQNKGWQQAYCSVIEQYLFNIQLMNMYSDVTWLLHHFIFQFLKSTYLFSSFILKHAVGLWCFFIFIFWWYLYYVNVIAPFKIL